MRRPRGVQTANAAAESGCRRRAEGPNEITCSTEAAHYNSIYINFHTRYGAILYGIYSGTFEIEKIFIYPARGGGYTKRPVLGSLIYSA